MQLFNQSLKTMLNEHEIWICPIVRLELQYLHGIGRVTEPSQVIISDLADRIGLQVCGKDFNAIISRALQVTWTRDPFDRVIVANAALNENILISKDRNILDNYRHTRW